MPKRTRDYREGLLKSLLDSKAAALYVNAALEDSDEMFLIALRDVAEARQMAKVASDAGLSRESIYRTLSESGNPRYNSLLGILRAVGLRLAIEPNLSHTNSEGLESKEGRISELAAVSGSVQTSNVRQGVTDIDKYRRFKELNTGQRSAASILSSEPAISRR
jgi:probable addiction module antidote protein